MNQNRLSHKTPDRESRSKDEYSEVYVWGSNHHGQLGLEERSIGKSHSTPRVLTLNFIIKEISCGEDHAALVTTRGHVYTIGSNAEGRLGIGSRSIDRVSHPTLIESLLSNKCMKISCGWAHTLALMESGEIYSWGAGESGALGNGSSENTWAPTRISLENKVFLSAKKISAGAFHSAFVSELGTLYVCGSGDAGQLGTGKREKEIFPVQMTLMTERVKDVACGVYHTLILTERSKVYATGGNILGQLGLGSKKNTNIPTRIKDLDYQRVVKVACGQHSAALTEKGEVYVWGTGVFGEQVIPFRYSSPGQVFKDISLNGFFGVVLDQDNGIWTWGGNNNGELGLGHYDPSAKLIKNDLLRDKRINRFACGVSFVIASVGNDESLFQPSISPLKHHRRSVGLGDSQRTPHKAEFEHQEEITQRIFGATSASESKLKSKVAHRHSSVHKIREADIPPYQRKTSTERVPPMNNRPESPEFIDLLAGEKRRSEKRREEREKADNLGIIEKLLKQKENLEKSLVIEREEKASLEHNLMVLNKRLQQIESGPEGLRDLSENFKRQAKKFNELRDYYEDETKMKEKISHELKSEQIRSKEFALRLEEKQDIIAALQVKVEQGENSRKKVYDLESAKQKLVQQVEILEMEKKAHIFDLHKLKDCLSEANTDLTQKNDTIHRLESLRRSDQDELNKLQNEVLILNQKLKDFTDRHERNLRNLDQESELRRQLEDDLRASKHREEENKDHIKRLISEMEHLKGMYERNMEDEHENRSKLLQENNSLTQQLNGLQEELNQVYDEKADLEAEFEETQQKNSRLMELFNHEIDRQSEALHQKTQKTAKKTANLSFELTDDSKDEVKRHEISHPTRTETFNQHITETINQARVGSNLYKSQFAQEKSFQSTNLEPLSRSVIEPRSGALDRSTKSPIRNPLRSPLRSPHRSPMRNDTDLNTSDFGRSREREVNPYVSLDEKPTKETYLNRSRVQSQDFKDQSFEDALPETKRREALGGSALKRNSVLNDEASNEYERIDASKILTPAKNTSILIKDEGTHSGRSKGVRSPLKDLAATLDSKETETLGGDDKDYLDDIKEVQSKMNSLERQKNDLYVRMQEFEKRMSFDDGK